MKIENPVCFKNFTQLFADYLDFNTCALKQTFHQLMTLLETRTAEQRTVGWQAQKQ